MKNDRLALMLLACSAASSAFAQGALPSCETSNYDQVRGIFTVINPAPGTVVQQCLLTIHPAQASASGAQFPAPFLVEGYYNIVLSGGGGGGGGGGSDGGGGGGGGGGAAPFKTTKLLLPGVYKLTIGTGGEGGMPGGSTQAGNPTSLTNANTSEHIAGFRGADRWTPRYEPAGTGRGGVAAWDGSNGGDGAKRTPMGVVAAQPGGMLRVADYSGTPGQASNEVDPSVRTAQPRGTLQIASYFGAPGPSGGETGPSAQTDDGRVVRSLAGGGGGAGFGNGGAGQPADGRVAAGMGDLGGGGGGGRGSADTADPGARGGHGFIQLAMSEPAPQVSAAAPEAAARSPVTTTPEPAAILPARKDRN